MIKEFQGSYRFLSNFYPCRIVYEGIAYLSVEAFYQAQKTFSVVRKREISQMRPGQAKRAGRDLVLRYDWEEIKLEVMEKGLRLKFADPDLKALLLETGVQELIEGNYWGDEFWGVYNGKGQNNLGKLLMKVRKDLSDG